MIYEYGLTNGDKTTVGYYTGTMVRHLIQISAAQLFDSPSFQYTLFFITEMIFVFQWGRASDR